MDFLYSYILFFAKTFTIVIAFITILSFIFFLASKGKKFKTKKTLVASKLNDKFKEMKKQIEDIVLTKKELKKKLKAKKKQEKSNNKKTIKNKLYLLNFKGDIKASAVENLRDEVTAILQVIKPQDEVVLNLESPGGTVNGYGLAASQLIRIRDKNIPFTVCVDTVAASGGYLMASTANQILAAPFAIIGSIGVLAIMPNFNKFLKKHDISVEEHTSGEYKRTVSMLGDITKEGREKFKESLEDIHHLFKEHISEFRKDIDMEKVGTGEYWLAKKAIDLKLIDKLMTSDEYLVQQSKDMEIIDISYKSKKSMCDKFGKGMMNIANTILSSKFIN